MNRERLPLGAALDLMDDRGFNLHLRALEQLQVANMLVPGDIGDFDTATLIEVLYAPAQAPELVAFWLKFFPRTIQFDTQEIRFDSQDLNEYRLAPFVAPNVQGRVLRSKGYSVQSFRPAYVKPKHVVDPARSIPRRAGERPFGTLSLQERFDAIVADNLRRERAVIENRWEWMACKALVDATVTVVGEDYPSVTVDFKRDPSLTVTLAGAAKWDQPTATVMADIQAIRQQSFKLGRSPIQQMIFGLDAWGAFVQEDHDDVQLLLDGLRKGNQANFNSLGLLTGGPYEFQGTIAGFAGGGRLDLWTYHYQFEELDTGTDDYVLVDYLDSGTVVGVAPGTDGVRCYGAIMDVRANMQATEMFPKQWEEEDPSVSYTMTQSAPLMVPLRPNTTFKYEGRLIATSYLEARMPSLIPTHSVFLSRPRQDGRKDAQGNPKHERVAPKIGEPFDFTDEEVADIRASDPTGLREPINEGGSREEREAEEAVRKAQEEAAKNRGAPVRRSQRRQGRGAGQGC
jgi:hypothetical protein